jgi:hypothetical protein
MTRDLLFDSAEKIPLPARYGHGAKGLAPSKGITSCFLRILEGANPLAPGRNRVLQKNHFSTLDSELVTLDFLNTSAAAFRQ